MKLAEHREDDAEPDNEGQKVGDGHRAEHPVEPEGYGQKKGEAHAEDHLAHEAQKDGGQRLADGLKENEGRLIHRGERHKAEVYPERLYGEIGIIRALICRSEGADKRPRKQLYYQESDCADSKFGEEKLF